MKYKLFTDGGARGNPGPAGIGYIIFSEKELVAFDGQYLGESTNNQAEYAALILGLKQAVKLDITDLICFLDSELIVKQLNGIYKVENDKMKIEYAKVMKLVEKFIKIEFEHVVRANNKFADKLVNIALDAKLSN